jgi:hypothetical protein
MVLILSQLIVYKLVFLRSMTSGAQGEWRQMGAIK